MQRKIVIDKNNLENSVIIYVSLKISSANLNELVNRLTTIVSKARKVKGCIIYQWFKNPENENNIIVYGEFSNMQNFVNYRKSSIVVEIGEQIIPLLQEPPFFKHFICETYESSDKKENS